MKQASFTAKELFGMAYLMRKRKMYGIPDVLGPERQIAIQDAIDALISQDIATMDMDGKIALQPVYAETVNTYCDCRKCLTVNVRLEDGVEHSYIFWQQADSYTMAEVVDDRYVFSRVDAQMVAAMVGQNLWKGESRAELSETVIPQLEIVKAKRVCKKGDCVEAARMIRRHCADGAVSNVIDAGLQETSYFLTVVYMDMQTGQCQKKERIYIADKDLLLSLGETTVNFRTCATFTPVTGGEMQAAVGALVDGFLDEKED